MEHHFSLSAHWIEEILQILFLICKVKKTEFKKKSSLGFWLIMNLCMVFRCRNISISGLFPHRLPPFLIYSHSKSVHLSCLTDFVPWYDCCVWKSRTIITFCWSLPNSNVIQRVNIARESPRPVDEAFKLLRKRERASRLEGLGELLCKIILDSTINILIPCIHHIRKIETFWIKMWHCYTGRAKLTMIFQH